MPPWKLQPLRLEQLGHKYSHNNREDCHPLVADRTVEDDSCNGANDDDSNEESIFPPAPGQDNKPSPRPAHHNNGTPKNGCGTRKTDRYTSQRRRRLAPNHDQRDNGKNYDQQTAGEPDTRLNPSGCHVPSALPQRDGVNVELP